MSPIFDLPLEGRGPLIPPRGLLMVWGARNRFLRLVFALLHPEARHFSDVGASLPPDSGANGNNSKRASRKRWRTLRVNTDRDTPFHQYRNRGAP